MSNNNIDENAMKYRHEDETILNGKHTIIEEEVRSDSKGFSFKLFVKKDQDKKKYIGKLDKNNKNEYRFIEIHNDQKKEEGGFTLDTLLDRIKGIPELDFVIKAMKKKKSTKGSAKGGARLSKTVPKTPKKGSKKVSKKTKKTSKKQSKK